MAYVPDTSSATELIRSDSDAVRKAAELDGRRATKPLPASAPHEIAADLLFSRPGSEAAAIRKPAGEFQIGQFDGQAALKAAETRVRQEFEHDHEVISRSKRFQKSMYPQHPRSNPLCQP